MKVLVACEESQEVCKAFRNKGHEAYSCDILECSGGHPEWHIKGDCLPILNGNCEFVTMNGKVNYINGKWDMIIAHPPCTRLCSSGQRWLYYGSKEYQDKKREEQKKAIEFFMIFTKVNCDKVAIENPIGIMSSIYRKPDCIYNPYDFKGETECKKPVCGLKVCHLLNQINCYQKRKGHRIFGKLYLMINNMVGTIRKLPSLEVRHLMVLPWQWLINGVRR